MMRNSIAYPRGKAWLRVSLALVAWAATVFIVEAASENEIGKSTRQREQRIELQLELMERFGAKNTAGLVFFAVKNNLID